jgi:plasmid maintenance system antidote protein VapI
VLADEAPMLTTKRKPATVGEILVEEFMQPTG